jgi:hypothetical protein
MSRFLDRQLSLQPHFEMDLLAFAGHLGIAETGKRHGDPTCAVVLQRLEQSRINVWRALCLSLNQLFHP